MFDFDTLEDHNCHMLLLVEEFIRKSFKCMLQEALILAISTSDVQQLLNHSNIPLLPIHHMSSPMI